jgi:hypothetical protein
VSIEKYISWLVLNFCLYIVLRATGARLEIAMLTSLYSSVDYPWLEYTLKTKLSCMSYI